MQLKYLGCKLFKETLISLCYENLSSILIIHWWSRPIYQLTRLTIRSWLTNKMSLTRLHVHEEWWRGDDLERWPCRRRWRHVALCCSSSDCCETVSDTLWRRGARRQRHSSWRRGERGIDDAVGPSDQPCCHRWHQNPWLTTLSSAADLATSTPTNTRAARYCCHHQSINLSISLLAALRPGDRIANNVQLKM